MVVLITNVNKEFVKELHPKVKFTDSTKNTSTFRVSEKKFMKMVAEVTRRGINRYALFVH